MFKYSKRVVTLLLMSNVALIAEVDLQRGIYDAADEMMRYDEKMNQAIKRHNQITPERDRVMRLNDNNLEDFEDTEYGYQLKENINDPENSKVNVSLSNGMVIISVTTIKKEQKVSALETFEKIIEKSSVSSLPIPYDADRHSFQKSYENGVLEITFLKNKNS